ncbi:MAG: response regulator transcription factor [Anaerolineales bacterium]|nr:response regulator transcription factor [Anaerolineales bacterium]
MIRVVIAEDHTMVREGLRALLERAGRFHILAEARDGAEAIALTGQHRPDVLILDIAMPDMTGLEVSRRLLAGPGAPAIVILSMYDHIYLINQLLALGVKGYLPKAATPDELVLAVTMASQGIIYVSPLIGGPAGDGRETLPPISSLTDRELQVLSLIFQGATNVMMAEQLGLSPRTIEKHRASLMEKLDVTDLASLIRVALHLGLVEMER